MGTFTARPGITPVTVWSPPTQQRRNTWAAPAAAMPMAFRDPVLSADVFTSETRLRGCGTSQR